MLSLKQWLVFSEITSILDDTHENRHTDKQGL